MPTTLNVNEAKTNFSSMLAEVESASSTFTIMRYGRPIARVVPIEHRRTIRPLPGYGTKIKIVGDIFANEAESWENA